MKYREHIREAIRRADSVRTAAKPSKEPPPWLVKGESGMDQPPGLDQARQSREIPKNHKFEPKALKPLAKMLWAMSVSMGHALQAYRLFNRVKSSTVSPDGLLGGRGYVMKVSELRQKIYDAVEALSAVSDTIHDEINAPHWKPKIGELTKEDFESIERLMGESEKNLDKPEDEVDEEEEEVEKKGKPSTSWVKKMKGDKSDRENASDLPTGGDAETVPRGRKPSDSQSDGSRPKFAAADAVTARVVLANSSVNPNTLPGPRIEHLDRADTDQTGPFGAVNKDPFDPHDAWSADEGVSGAPMSQDRGDQPVYEWDGGRWAAPQAPVSESAMPTDQTPTDAWDFGIGRGNGDDAHGDGAGGYGLSNDQGARGVYGPRAELPDDPGGPVHDREYSDTTPVIEERLTGVLRAARTRLQQVWASGQLPGDSEKNVSRSDYFTGPKDNDQDTIKGPTENPVLSGDTAESELPNSSPPSPPRPLVPRPMHYDEFQFAQAQLPGDGTAVDQFSDMDLMNTGYRYERADDAYIKRDRQGPSAKPGN